MVTGGMKKSDRRVKGNESQITPELNYKNVEILQKLVSPQGKIYSRKRASASAKAQAVIKREIKRARYMALLPFRG